MEIVRSNQSSLSMLSFYYKFDSSLSILTFSNSLFYSSSDDDLSCLSSITLFELMFSLYGEFSNFLADVGSLGIGGSLLN